MRQLEDKEEKETSAFNAGSVGARLTRGEGRRRVVKRRCSALTRKGKPCPNFAMLSKTKCNFHSGLASAAGMRGGRRRARFNHDELEPIAQPQNVQDVLRALGQVFSEVHGGKIEPRVANACAYLASGILQALSVGNFEERIAALEARHEAMRAETI